MADRTTCSNSATKARAEEPTDDASNNELGNTTRAIAQQPAGGLLSLPAEIRQEICSYLTLSPISRDSIANRSILNTCRQLQQDMIQEHGSAKGLDSCIKVARSMWSENGCTNVDITLGQPSLLTRFIRSVTIHMPASHLMPPQYRKYLHSTPECYCERALLHLYKLHLDRLHINVEDRACVLASDKDATFEDKLYCPCPPSLHPCLFTDYVLRVRAGKVNCRTVVFTVPEEANAEGGRDKTTVRARSDKDTGISYTLTVVKDKVGWPVEREFTSETRFRRGVYRPE